VPGEEFGIVIAPATDLPAGTPLSETVTIPDVIPFRINRMVPRTLAPVVCLD
jgi:hypothetical protein